MLPCDLELRDLTTSPQAKTPRVVYAWNWRIFCCLETCACTKNLTTTYHVTSPYVSFNRTTSMVAGLIPTILKLIMRSCCGDCVNGHGKTYIDYQRDYHGNRAEKTNITEFIRNDAAHTDLVFPINGFEGKLYCKLHYYPIKGCLFGHVISLVN